MIKKPTTVKICNNRITLIGYSRAGDATSIYVPEMGYQLDAGALVTEQKPSKLFLSHSHSDHCYQTPYFYNRKNLLDVYAPEGCCQFLGEYLTSAQNLNDCKYNGTPPKYTIRPVASNQTIVLDKMYKVDVIECFHTVPSVGYLFSEQRSKLKQEYLSLTGKDIGALRKQGVEVSESISVPLFAFLGDTTPEVFETNPQLFNFSAIIVECTFLEGEQLADKGHTHWSALKPIVEQHPDITFILIHFSCIYKNKEILEFFTKENLKNVVPLVEQS